MVLDREGALKRLGDMEPVLEELTLIFVEEAPNRKANLENAMDTEDWEIMAREAHSLKSGGATIGAVSFASWANTLEKAARARDSRASGAALPHVLAELESLMNILSP